MTNSHHQLTCLLLATVALGAACSSDTTAAATVTPVTLAQANPNVSATAGAAFSYDATLSHGAFSGTNLSYTVTFSPTANGMSASGGVIAGTPATPCATVVTITASNSVSTAVDTFTIFAFASTLNTPSLPATRFAYADAEIGLPAHFTAPVGPGGSVAATDNTPSDNLVTDAGATLGRVLFYDRRLSANDQEACASCHLQALGFSDTAHFSHGFQGGLTVRHAMSLGNARYYARGKFFWDERATTLEAQTLMPIQNSVEMGMTLDNLVTKLKLTSFYPALFQAAFGTTDITSDRISKALAQFVRSMATYQSKYDRALAAGPTPDFSAFTSDEILGMQLFMAVPGSPVPTVGCDRCHTTAAQVSDNIHNNGLDAVSVDTGAGGGRFKAPSLRNVGTRAAFMHDGRFTTLRQVLDQYNAGVQASPNLDPRLRNPDGSAHRLNLASQQLDAIVAFLNTLTDSVLITNPKFSNPFSH
jgi:cytochrome c peroxidase